MITQFDLSIRFICLQLALLAGFSSTSDCFAAPSTDFHSSETWRTSSDWAAPFPGQFDFRADWGVKLGANRRSDEPLAAASPAEWLARLELTAQHLLPNYRISTWPECSVVPDRQAHPLTNRANSSDSVELYLYNKDRANQALSIVLRPDQEIVALSRRSNGPESTPEIVLSIGLLQQIRSTAELAFVLSHELAHVQLQHFSYELPLGIFTQQQLARIAEIHVNRELRADDRALQLMTAAGYQAQHASAILARIQGKILRHDPVELRSHPTLAARLEALHRVSQFLQTAGLTKNTVEDTEISARYLEAPSK